MPNELNWDSVTGTGETWDAYRFLENGNVLLSNGASNEVWGTGGGGTYDADDYDIPISEVGVIGHYVGDFDPDNVVVTGRYIVKYTKRAGVNPADSDKIRARGPINWDGVNHVEIFSATEAKQDIIDGVVDNILVDTNEIQGKLPVNKFMGSSDGANDDGNIANIAFDTAGLQGDAMVGTDNAALASALVTHHTALTNHAGVLNAHHTDLGELVSPIDETWERVMANLDVVLSTRMAPSDLSAAMKAIIGITVGGTWTWEKIMKICTAWISGNWRIKPTDNTKQELMDAENGTTVILEQSLSQTTPYRTITVKI